MRRKLVPVARRHAVQAKVAVVVDRTVHGAALILMHVGTPTLHSCRHTFGTNLVLAGVDIVTVKELLSHADIKTTMRYSHPTPESKRNAVNLLSNENSSGT